MWKPSMVWNPLFLNKSYNLVHISCHFHYCDYFVPIFVNVKLVLPLELVPTIYSTWISFKLGASWRCKWCQLHIHVCYVWKKLCVVKSNLTFFFFGLGTTYTITNLPYHSHHTHDKVRCFSNGMIKYKY